MNAARRFEMKEDKMRGQFSNPLTGAVIPHRQTTNLVDVLAVPGDFDSATETTTGQNNLTVPGLGAVLLTAGRVVGDPDGNVNFRAGPQAFLDYFVDGNTAVVDQVCATLGA